MAEQQIIRPQPGKQEKFLSSGADIVIMGGGAGGSKTFSLLLDPCRYLNNGKFGAVIFRRTSPQITNEGGMWDEAGKIYPYLGGRALKSFPMQYQFPKGSKISFSHLQYEETKKDWDGSQIAYLGFDQLEHFTRGQFFYMLSRNRSDSGVPPCIRATMNPDADSWTAEFIKWYWDQDTGYPIEERDGVIRWFAVIEDQVQWADSRQELIDKFQRPELEILPKSFAYINATVYDNPILVKNNPGYVANLMAMPLVERERLLKSNYKIRAIAGNIFKWHWFKEYSEEFWRIKKSQIERWVRAWDLGGSDSPKSDYTAGLLMGKTPDIEYYVPDIQRGQWSAKERDDRIVAQGIADQREYGQVEYVVEDLPGNANVVVDDIIIRLNKAGVPARKRRAQGKKASRAQKVSAATEAGIVHLRENAEWKLPFMNECMAFSENEKDYDKDDQVDVYAMAYNELTEEVEEFSFG